MDRPLAPLLSHLRTALSQPHEGARRLLALDLPMGAIWAAFGLVVAASAIVASLQAGLMLAGTAAEDTPEPLREIVAIAAASPFMVALGQGVFLLIATTVLHRLGRALGGTGDFAGSLLVMALFEAGLILLLVVQLVALMLLPPLAGLFGFAFLIYLVWHVPSFVMALHGFTSRIAVIGMIVVGFVVTQVALSILAGMLAALVGGGAGDV